jgi:hypothetical protein
VFLSPAPETAETKQFALEMTLSRTEEAGIKRWRRNEGAYKPKKGPGPPEGNLNPMKHGIFANQCLDDEERESFDELIQRLYQDLEFNLSGCGTHRQASRATSCNSSSWPSTR